MAFAVIKTTATTELFANLVATLNLPSGIVDGDLLIMGVTLRNGQTATWPAGWTQIGFLNKTVDTSIEIRFRDADGTEGATIAVTLDTSASGCVGICYRIDSHHSSTAPEASTGADANSSTPDPDSLNPAGWGTEDTMWLVFCGHKTSIITAAPSSYTNLIAENNATAIAAGSARRELNAASEDPGTFTAAGSNRWTAMTVAIRPAAAGRTTRNTDSWALGTNVGMGFRMP